MRAWATILVAMALASCEETPTLLIVDLRTDLVPGVEIDGVRTQVVSGSAARSVDHVVDPERDYGEGVRVAELMGLEQGEVTLRVVLLRDGAEVVARPVRVTLEGSGAITVVVTRDCRGVACPAPDGDPIAEACVGGVCTDPRCTEEQPQACDAECMTDADCPAPAASCASARCAGGVCLAIADDAACDAEAYCEAETGCQPREPSACPPFPGTSPDLQAFGDYTCVVAADEPLRCWGANNIQLGAPFMEPVGAPRDIQPARRWSRIALGSAHWCGIDQSGSQLVECVGTDWIGQLGNGAGEAGSSALMTTSPPLVALELAASEGFNCAIASDGRLWCWGGNEVGEVGVDTVEHPVWEPTAVASTETWASIDASGPHACGITTGGALYCWGSNANADLARDPSVLERSRVPLAIGSDTDWVEVSVGREFVLARKSDGTLWSWGGNFDGQLGRAGAEAAVLQVGSANDWEQLAAGFRHACGLRAGGALWCWGANRRGQLSEAVTATEVNVPTRLLPDHVWIDVAVGYGHTCALDDSGRVWCWGANDEQQLGAGAGDNRPTPAIVCP